MYCTKAQLISWFGERELIQRTDRPPLTGTINDTVLADAISAAERKIDGYLKIGYALPLAAGVIAESALPEICGALVRYTLFQNVATDEIKERHKEAMEWLRDVRAGLVTLGKTDDSVPETGKVTVQAGVSGTDWATY